MRAMKRAAQLAVFVLCVVFTVGAIVNVFSDNAEVEKLAGQVACDTPPAAATATATAKPGARPAATATPGAAANPGACAMTMTRMSRSPFGQSFEFTGRSSTRRIRCTRSLFMFGEYSCVPE